MSCPEMRGGEEVQAEDRGKERWGSLRVAGFCIGADNYKHTAPLRQVNPSYGGQPILCQPILEPSPYTGSPRLGTLFIAQVRRSVSAPLVARTFQTIIILIDTSPPPPPLLPPL